MQKFLISGLLSFWLIGSAMAQTYSLAFSNQAYNQLQNDTVLTDTNWVGKLIPLKIPFNVRISNLSINQLYINVDGQIMRRSTSGGFIFYRTLIYGFGNCGLRQKKGEVSHISYVTEGVSPNRIVKIQFRNAGFVGDEKHQDKINFQIWLYESGKQYEVCFGPKSLIPNRALNGAYGPLLGIGSQYLRGTPAAPLLGTPSYGFNGIPDSSFTYRFTRP
jgi:hypothetical protein